MPTKKAHIYTVSMILYISQEAKDDLEIRRIMKSPAIFTSKLYYNGLYERQAGFQFYRALQEATQNPLAYHVTLMRSGEIVLRLKAPFTHHPG